MLDSHSEACSRLIESFGGSWPIIGWALFAGWFFSPYFAPDAQIAMAAYMGLGLLGLIWWTIDALDQQVAGWQVLIAAIMIAIGLLPRGGLLLIAAWIIYWTRVRE